MGKKKIVFATGNPGKLREAGEILGDGFDILSAAEAGVPEEIPETGTTLQENAFLKADHIWRKTGLDCFADDTGLEVDALGGAPGIHTARYAGEGKDFQANIDKLLRELEKVPAETGPDRSARFRTSVALITAGTVHYFDGVMEGSIARERHGSGGFGYDPVFCPEGCGGLTAAEITEEEKNAISHRGKALRAMAAYLKETEG